MELGSHLTILESSGLIYLAQVQPELEYLFRHTLVQEAAYGSLLKTDRRQLHRVVGDTLEQLYPDRLEELAPFLAQHFYRAEEAQRAFHYFTLAGDAAFRSYANSEAIAHYTYALELAEKAGAGREELMRLYLRRGRAYELNADYQKALDNYETMKQVALAQGDQHMVLAALISSATIYATPTSVHDFDRAEALCDEALELALKLGDRASEARIYWNRLILGDKTGNPAKAVEYGEHAIALARELNLTDILAYALNDISQAYMNTGQLYEGKAALMEARELWRASGNFPMLADSLGTSSFYDFFLGRYDQAIEEAGEALRISQMIDNKWGQAYANMFVEYVYQEIGEFGKAITSIEECLRLSEQAGFIAPFMSVQSDLGLLYARLGQFEKGEAYAVRAFNVAKESQVLTWRFYAMGVLAQVSLLAGDLKATRSYILKGERLLKKSQAPNLFHALHIIAQAGVAFAEGDFHRLLDVVEQLNLLRGMGVVAFVYEFLYLRAVALFGTGQEGAAEDSLREALNLAESLQARRVLWSIYFTFSQFEAGRGNLVASQRYLQQAKDVLNYILEHIGSDELAASFRAMPQVRQVLDALPQT